MPQVRDDSLQILVAKFDGLLGVLGPVCRNEGTLIAFCVVFWYAFRVDFCQMLHRDLDIINRGSNSLEQFKKGSDSNFLPLGSLNRETEGVVENTLEGASCRSDDAPKNIVLSKFLACSESIPLQFLADY